MIRYEPQRHGTLTRQDIAAVLAAISPVTAPQTDYMRGYLEALCRVATGLSIAVNGDLPTVEAQ
jgi:hypothetical protein